MQRRMISQLFLDAFCERVCFTGEYLLFCKGADSSIFPLVVSGKVEQVKARVEQNAVVSTHTGSATTE